MPKTTVLFVINPIAGDSNKDNLDHTIKKYCEQEAISYELHETTGKNDKEKIKEALEKWQPETVVACGGDGTINLVAENLLHSDIKLGIMPLGSANGLATEFGISEVWNENLRLLKEGTVKTIDALRVNDEHLSLHLSDVGFNAKMIKQFEKEGKRGKLAYAKSFIGNFFKRKPHKFYIHIKENTYSQRADMIVFANAAHYGTGANVNPRCDMQDGLFEICVFKPIPWYKFAELTWQSFSGRLEESPYFTCYQAEEAVVSSKKKNTLQVDGEVIGNFKKIKLNVIKKAVHLLVPQP